jgi:hypothetical protein
LWIEGGIGTSASHLADPIYIQGLKSVIKLQDKRQPHGNLSRGHGKDKNEHNLPVGLSPMNTGNHKSQASRIQHDFDGEEDEKNVAPYNDTDDPKGEKDACQDQTVL